MTPRPTPCGFASRTLSTTRTRRSRTCKPRGLKITIESFNYQIRKVIKNRGHFPTDDAVVKLIWLAIADIEDKRARQRAAEAGKAANARTAPGRLVEGAGVHGWKQALNALEIFFPGRIPVDAR
jgi:putative transposase